MSKIVIEFEDNPDGTVRAEINPTVTELLNKWKQKKEPLTAAEGYAIRAINATHEASTMFERNGTRKKENKIVRPHATELRKKFREN